METTAKTQKANENVVMTVIKGDVGMKTCRCCGRLLPLTSFDKNKQCRDGHVNICRSCKWKRKKETATKRLATIQDPVTVSDIKNLSDDAIAKELISRGWKGKITKSVTIDL